MQTSNENAPQYFDPLTPQTPEAEKVKQRSRERRPRPAHMLEEVQPLVGDFLGLPGLRTSAPPEVSDFSMRVMAVQDRPAACPYCGRTDKLFRPSNGTRKRRQHLLDEPRGFRRVCIEITRRNFRCEGCGSSGLLPLYGVGVGQHLTDRLVHHVKNLSLLRPHAEVARMTGLSERKVTEIFNAHVRHLEETVYFAPPRVIGLDGIKLRGKGRFVVITDLERRLVLHMWDYSRKMRKKDSKAAVKALVAMLQEINGADQIKFVVIDMSRQFRSAIQEALPQAKIIIDRYHIERMANGAIDETRKRLLRELKEEDRKEKTRKRLIKEIKEEDKKKEDSKIKMCHASMLRKRHQKLKDHQQKYLEEWFTKHPSLGWSYESKEEYCLMWELKTKPEARRYYEKWTRRFAATVMVNPEEAGLRDDFDELLTAMSNWGEYIFNYFDLKKKMTNGYTEGGANRRIRDIRRESRRVGIPVLRAKLIYGGWLKKRLTEEKGHWGESMV